MWSQSEVSEHGLRPCLQVVGAGGNGWALETPPLNGSSTVHGVAAVGPSIPSSPGWSRQGTADVWELREQV